MTTTAIPPFYIMGITVRTSNQNGQAATDIPALWQRLIAEHIDTMIPGKTDDTIYCVYTDYEGDYTLPYTTLLGYRINTLPDQIPEGLAVKTIGGGKYTRFESVGKLAEGAVFKTWQHIWSSDTDRAYTSDYEVYDASVFSEAAAIVPIYIALQ